MSKSGWRGPGRLLGMLVLGLFLAGGVNPAYAADKVSSAKDKARFVAITRSLEAAPIVPFGHEDREWALQWLTEAPDITVEACLASLGGGAKKTYPYGPEVFMQYVFTMGVALIEHPELAADPDAVQLAGVEGALRAYAVIVRTKEDGRSPELDALVDLQARGELAAFVSKADCKD